LSNYSFAIWIVLSAGLLGLFLYAALINLRRRHLPQVDLDEIIPYLRPVHMDVLSQLTDSSHDEYLRRNGSRHEFQKLQRKQFRLATEYLQRMSHNAALLQRIGYGQIHSQNPLIAAQAQELIDAGVHVRLYSFIGLALLFSWRVVGPLSFKIADMKKLMACTMVPAYQSLKDKAENLTTIRDTSFRAALLQSL
jgi:hypothetical protein